MIEGPGSIKSNWKKYEIRKEYCHEAPFYILGPLITDIAAGYDHISSAIGAAAGGWHGASMLCYITQRKPGLLQMQKMLNGIIAYKIAPSSLSRYGKRKKRCKEILMMKCQDARYAFNWNRHLNYV